MRSHRVSFGCWFSLVILIGTIAIPSVSAQTQVIPDGIEGVLSAVQCLEHAITVTMDAAPLPGLDVVLLIDVTGSMMGVLSAVTQNAELIVEDVRELVPDAAFALATFADYPPGESRSWAEYGDIDDYSWQLDQDLTQDVNLIEAALGQVDLLDGGDTPESYLRALSETRSMSWRPSSRRVVILFGDSYPHDPDPGPDAEEGTADDLTRDIVIEQLTESNITVLAVYTSVAFQQFYDEVSAATGGESFMLGRVEDVPSAIQQLVASAVSKIQTLTLRIDESGRSWSSWTPDVYHDVPPLAQREFNVEICAPEGVLAGDYSFDLYVTGDGVAIGRVPVSIHIPKMRGGPFLTVFWPWWLVIPIVLLLGGLLWWLLRRRSMPRRIISPPPSRGNVTVPSSEKPKKIVDGDGASIWHGRPRPPRSR